MGFMDQFKGAMSAGAPTAADMEKMQQITRLNEVGVEHPATITSLAKTGRTDPGGVEYEIAVDVQPEGGDPLLEHLHPVHARGVHGQLGDGGRRGQGPRRPRRPHRDDPVGRADVARRRAPRSYPCAAAASHSSLIWGRGWGESSSTTPMWRPATLRVIT